MRQAILVLVGVTLLTAVAGMQTKVGTAADEAAIRKAWADYVTTWNKHDAMALASFYTDDVDRRTQNGKVSDGRAAVVGAIDDEFRGTNKKTVLSTVQLDVRFVNRDVAILDARDELRGTEGAEASVVKTNHTSVFVRRDSKWLTVAIRAFRF